VGFKELNWSFIFSLAFCGAGAPDINSSIFTAADYMRCIIAKASGNLAGGIHMASEFHFQAFIPEVV
jgi:hypothetical protein